MKTITTTVKVATLEDLKNFLKDNGALTRYVRNLIYKNYCRIEVTGLDVTLDVKQIMVDNGLISRDFIISAFSWGSSPEGYAYWSTLDYKFIEWCKTNNIEAFEVE